MSLYNFFGSYEKQLKEFKDKGYYLLEDGTKSTDVHVPGKKKRADKSPAKKTDKRKSAPAKDTGKVSAAKRGASARKSPAKKGGKSKQTDSDELDIEGTESEASQVQDSD